MVFHEERIGVDTLYTPAGFLGSPLFSSDASINSHLIADYKNPTRSWPGITVMSWLRFDDLVLSTATIPIIVS